MSRIDEVFSLVEQSHRRGLLSSQQSLQFPQESVVTGFYPDGETHFRFFLKNGKLHGPGRIWSPGGQLLREDIFFNGILHGRQRGWHDNGQPKIELDYVNGAFHGRRREWHDNGRMKCECFYQMNLLHGVMTEWSANGLVREQVNFWEGQRHGIEKEYAESGELIAEKLYVRGVHFNGRIERLLSTGKLTARHILRIRNTAVRRICLEELGYERFYRQVPHQVIDADEHNELVRIVWHREEEPVFLVKVQCPTTGAFYMLRVPPSVTTIRQAVAWTFGVAENDYHPQEES